MEFGTKLTCGECILDRRSLNHKYSTMVPSNKKAIATGMKTSPGIVAMLSFFSELPVVEEDADVVPGLGSVAEACIEVKVVIDVGIINVGCTVVVAEGAVKLPLSRRVGNEGE